MLCEIFEYNGKMIKMSRNIDKRRQAITDMVNQMGSISLRQLKECFPTVSEVTLRKDLLALDQEQQLIRVHGGAKQLPHVSNFLFRTNSNQEEKRIIAEKAVTLIQPGGSVFIAAGTTCVELAKLLPSFPLFVCTDGLTTACSIPMSPSTTLEIFGGEVILNTMRVSGLSVLNAIERMHFNIAFLGTPGFHPDYGFSYLSELTAVTVQKIIQQSDKVVMLMDSSKVNYTFAPRSIPLESVDVIVTDDLLEMEVVEKIRAKGVTVL